MESKRFNYPKERYHIPRNAPVRFGWCITHDQFLLNEQMFDAIVVIGEIEKQVLTTYTNHSRRILVNILA